MDKITLEPIGVIHTPYNQPQGTPIHPTGGRDVEGWIDIFPKFSDGLLDLDGFSHIVLVFYFHLIPEFQLLVTPFMDDKIRGVFATRSPRRPNHIGISVVRLVKIEGNKIYFKDCDILDGTPLLDVKPYFPDLNPDDKIEQGWTKGKQQGLQTKTDDGRFTK